ncbi:MAG TPA: TniB family NTP-binding protein [Pyrinomonadaceae bacterium]|jgi:hypothetical protein|nr:TniB family NTP-binding protein [Pyrinomonadaceae bacterium]
MAKALTKITHEPQIDYLKMPNKVKLRLLGHIFIEHPRLKKLIRQIGHCHEYSKVDEDLDPEGMVIKGVAGVGKSKLISRYAEKFPRREEADRTIVPVLIVTIPQSATVKSLVSELLDALGDPFPDCGSAPNQTRRLRKLIKECGVEMIIADEFQHFIDRDSDRVLHDVSDWLKVLMDRTKKPIILIGMPHCDKILEANEQLKRRFTLRESIEPFGWKAAKQQDDFRELLRQIDGKLPFNQRSNLADPETAFRIYYATGGVIAYVMKLIRRAAILAIRQSLEKLNIDTLAYAFDKDLSKTFPRKENPFRVDDLSLLEIAPQERRHEVPGATSHRVKAKKAQLKASEVLVRRG